MYTFCFCFKFKSRVLTRRQGVGQGQLQFCNVIPFTRIVNTHLANIEIQVKKKSDI